MQWTVAKFSLVPKRNLKVTKWLRTTPAVAVCGSCNKEFRVPMTSLSRTTDAQEYLQEQFDRHKCDPEKASDSL
jgi:hypothetical protein